jgi:Family of unknown function (DUF6093)
MGRENVLLAGRAFLLTSGALTDACIIQRKTGEVTNLITGVVTPTYSTVYTGPCRVQAASANWAGPTEVAEAALRLASSQLQLPVEGTEGLKIDDRVTITASLNDADLVGRVFTLTGESRKSHATTRKLPLLEILS